MRKVNIFLISVLCFFLITTGIVNAEEDPYLSIVRQADNSVLLCLEIKYQFPNTSTLFDYLVFKETIDKFHAEMFEVNILGNSEQLVPAFSFNLKPNLITLGGDSMDELENLIAYYDMKERHPFDLTDIESITDSDILDLIDDLKSIDNTIQIDGISFPLDETWGSVLRVAINIDSETAQQFQLLSNPGEDYTVGPTLLEIPESTRQTRSYFDFNFDSDRLDFNNDDRALDFDLNWEFWLAGKDSDGYITFESEGLLDITDPSDSDNDNSGDDNGENGGESSSGESEENAQSDGNLRFRLGAGWIFWPTDNSFSDIFGGVDTGIYVTSENTSDFDVGLLGVGASVALYPRLDRVVGSISESMGSTSINIPPTLRFFAEYIHELADDESASELDKGYLTGADFRAGVEFDWRMELNEDFFMDLDCRYTWYQDAPLSNRTQTRFSYIDFNANYRINDDLWFYIGYQDGELAPIYEQDSRILSGLRVNFRSPDL